MSTPFEKEKRRLRLQKKQNQYKRAERQIKIWHYYDRMDEETRNKMIKLHAETRQNCSCYMCGNPRKFFNEKTKQELISDDSTKEEIEDLNVKVKNINNSHKLYHS